ncbi:hypothetical protein TNCV_1697951 [Trichonephila clavipes]|nr:hypothetical protein TNCV_1697951 [Trichonephila clavipes]
MLWTWIGAERRPPLNFPKDPDLNRLDYYVLCVSLNGRPTNKYKNTITRSCSRLPFDEAHFWLNGYVNQQNCRIWSEANPQVYVETPLHPEKLTDWSALWAGGIFLQKR